MILTSVWYHTGDKQPTKSGHYIAYKLPTYGDDSEGYELYYWDLAKREWREFLAPHSSTIYVSYWTKGPDVEHSSHSTTVDMPTPAEIDAWKNVMDAIDKYNMVKALVQ